MSTSSISRDEVNRKFHEMVLVYNAVMNGWKVRLRSDGTLKFTKRRGRDEEKETIDVDLEDQTLKDFIHEHINIEDLFHRHRN